MVAVHKLRCIGVFGYVYLVGEVLPRRAGAALDGDDGAVEQQALVHQPEAARAHQVGLGEVVGGVRELLQRELPGAVELRRRRGPAAPAPLRCSPSKLHA